MELRICAALSRLALYDPTESDCDESDDGCDHSEPICDRGGGQHRLFTDRRLRDEDWRDAERRRLCHTASIDLCFLSLYTHAVDRLDRCIANVARPKIDKVILFQSSASNNPEDAIF